MLEDAALGDAQRRPAGFDDKCAVCVLAVLHHVDLQLLLVVLLMRQ